MGISEQECCRKDAVSPFGITQFRYKASLVLKEGFQRTGASAKPNDTNPWRALYLVDS